MRVQDLIKWLEDEKLFSPAEHAEAGLLWFAANKMAESYVESFRTKDFADLIRKGESLGSMQDRYDLQRWLDGYFEMYSDSGGVDDMTPDEIAQATTELKNTLRAWFGRR